MRKVKRQSVVACLAGAACGLVGASVATAQTCYRLTDLRALGFTPGPDDSFGLNNLGEAAFTAVVNGEKHAFVWLLNPNYGLAAGLHDLNLLPDPDLSGPSAARDISAAGYVAGSATINGEEHAFVWKLAGGTANTIDLGTLEGGTWSRAYAITNDALSPVVVGESEVANRDCECPLPDPPDNDDPVTRGFRATVILGQQPQLFELAPTGSQSFARDVSTEAQPQIAGFSNCGGSICGSDMPCEFSKEPVVWDPGAAALSQLVQDRGSESRGTNDSRQIAGVGIEFEDCPTLRAVFWEPPLFAPFNLGTLPAVIAFLTRAEAINNPDPLGRIQVVGWNETQQVALVWERADPMSGWTVTDVNTVIAQCSNDWIIRQAHDINDSSWVIAWGVRDNQAHAVLLTPLAQCPPDTCDADLNGDGGVGILDLLTLLTAWGPCPDPPESCFADLNCDGSVGILDLLELLASWGPCATSIGEVPRTVEDCLNKFCCEEENMLALEKCLCAIEPQNCQ